MTRAIAVAVVALLRLATASLANGNALVIGQPAEVESVDPHRVSAVLAVERLYNLYDTLVNVDFDLATVRPGLAESWHISNDGRTYAFRLRRGVTFHSGKRLTAHDVKFTLDRWRAPDTLSPTRSLIADVEEVTAQDDQTLTITLRERSNYFLVSLASGFASILNPEAVKRHGAEYGTLAADGTGPFRFRAWLFGDRFVADRNPAYTWGPPLFANPGPARIERVIWRIIPDSDWRMFDEPGGVDVTRWMSFRQVARGTPPGLRVVRYRAGYTVYLGFNLTKEIVEDVRVRRAVSHAIDKEEIIRDVFGGVGVPAHGPVAPIVPGALGDAPAVAPRHDPAKARTLLDQAGWKPGSDGMRQKDGKPLRLPIHAIAAYGYPEVLALIQRQLRAVGVGVDPVLVPETAIWDRLRVREHTVVALGMPHSNPDEILGYHFASAARGRGNAFAFTDPVVDALLEEGRRVTDRARWRAAYAEIQRRVIASAVWIPLWHPDRIMVMKTRVEGLRPHPVYDVGYHKLLDVSVGRR